MKVVLKRDVKNLGKVGDICNVANGYGRNFLLPKGYAIIANKNNIALLEQKREELIKKNNELEKEAKQVAEVLNNEVFNVVRQAADDDTIYGSIRTKDIYNLILNLLKSKNSNFVFDIGGIEIQQIKSLGKYIIPVFLFGNISANIRLNVCRIASDFESDISSFDKQMLDNSQKTENIKKNNKLLNADKKLEKMKNKMEKKTNNDKENKNENKEVNAKAEEVNIDTVSAENKK